nr:integrase, catalytic region, zinc finger, CCHC-type, peptidase aspartic, catalytic [Tanacetum cinerariifolium]
MIISMFELPRPPDHTLCIFYKNGQIGVLGNANLNGNGNLVAARAEGNASGQDGNQIRCYNCRGVGHFARNCTVRPRRRDDAYLQTQLLIAQKEEAGIQLQAEEFDLMAAAADLDEIKEVNANCILMANLQQASTSGTQTDKAPVYDLDGSAESVYQEQCLSKKINVLHLCSSKQIMSLNEEISDLNKQLSKEKSIVSFLLKEKKRLKSDFKIREDELLDKQIQLEKKIKELNNILVKTGQSIQTIHMLSPKPDSFYHTEQKMALGFQNPFYLKQAQKKQQSLYDGKVLLEKHNPPVMHDSEETLQLSQESREKIKQLNKEIKPANYTKINHLSGVKNTIVTLQRVVKHRMTLETHNWSSFAHQELHKIVKDENFPIVNQVDAKVQNFEIQFLKEAAKFVGDLKSLAKEADESLAKYTVLELEIELLLRAVNTIYENAKLRAQLFKKVSVQKDNTRGTSKNTKFSKQSILGKPPMLGEMHALSKPVTSNSVPTPQESKVMKNDKVIALGMFRINAFKTSREEKHVPNIVRASARTKPITILQPLVITKKDVNSDSNGTVRFGNDHVAAILGFGQFYDSNLEVAFRRNACYFRNLEGVDLLKGDRSTNLYTINLHEMASASPICLMARTSSTKSWLWHQRLSHLNFDTINDLARNDLDLGLPKFKYHKEHLCPSCEQGKSKRVSHPPKPVPNLRQRLHLRHMDLCGPMRIASINGKRYVLVIVDDFSRYTWVHFLRSKDEAPEVIITFLKRITILLQSPVIIIRTDDGTELKNQLSAMAFEQRSLKPGLQSMTSGQVSSGLDLTYALSTITTQQPSEGELDLLFEAMYDDYIGGKPSATARTVPAAQEPQVHQTSTTSTSISDTGPTSTNSSSHATNIPITSQDVDELNPNAVIDANTFIKPFANPSTSAAESSSSHNVDPSNMHTFYVTFRNFRSFPISCLLYYDVAPHCYHFAAKSDFRGVTDWYQEPSVMDVPLLLDHAFDFFVVEPVPGLAEAPDNQNRWIEWDVPLGGEMDELMENPVFDEEEELNEFIDDDQGPSTATPVGHPLTTMASGVATQPQVIDDLCVRMSNLEYRHGELVKKMEIVSDAEAADSIAIREIHPRVTTLEGQVHTLQTLLHGAWLQNQQLQTRLSEMENHEGTLISFMCWMEDRLVVLEKRLIGPPMDPSSYPSFPFTMMI